jgi:hypothetical protein
VLGIYIHRVTKRFEHLQWRSQKLVEKRLAVYDDLAPHRSGPIRLNNRPSFLSGLSADSHAASLTVGSITA